MSFRDVIAQPAELEALAAECKRLVVAAIAAALAASEGGTVARMEARLARLAVSSCIDRLSASPATKEQP